MAPYEAPVTAAVLFSGRAAWAPWGGSWLVDVGMKAPMLAKGWRFMADVRAGSETRDGFYGLGNTDDIDPDATKDTEPFLYRMDRNLYAATIDVTRRIAGPLSASIMLNGAIADYSSLSPTSLFELTYGPELSQTEGSVTGALVLDLRNTEYDTRKGVLIEAGGQYGGSERNYSRWYGIARGWVPATKSTVLAARVFATNIGGTPTLLSQEVVPGWESPYASLGGEDPTGRCPSAASPAPACSAPTSRSGRTSSPRASTARWASCCSWTRAAHSRTTSRSRSTTGQWAAAAGWC